MATVIDGTTGTSIAGAGTVVGDLSVGGTLTATGAATLPTIKSSTSNTPPTIQDSAGTQIGTFCRAWVNFNGQTPAITSSFNVSSVTRQATGQFQITMTNAMVDKNYVVVGGVINGTTPLVNGSGLIGGNDQAGSGPNTQTTTTFNIGVFVNSTTFANLPVNNIVVFR
jgi:hypothetical protein